MRKYIAFIIIWTFLSGCSSIELSHSSGNDFRFFEEMFRISLQDMPKRVHPKAAFSLVQGDTDQGVLYTFEIAGEVFSKDVKDDMEYIPERIWKTAQHIWKQNATHTSDPTDPNNLMALLEINEFIKKEIKYKEDDVNFMKRPSLMLVDSGDCEDQAYMKYLVLRKIGFGPEDVALFIVDAERWEEPWQGGSLHAYLAVRLNNEEIIALDNGFLKSGYAITRTENILGGMTEFRFTSFDTTDRKGRYKKIGPGSFFGNEVIMSWIQKKPDQ